LPPTNENAPGCGSRGRFLCSRLLRPGGDVEEVVALRPRHALCAVAVSGWCAPRNDPGVRLVAW